MPFSSEERRGLRGAGKGVGVRPSVMIGQTSGTSLGITVITTLSGELDISMRTAFWTKC